MSLAKNVRVTANVRYLLQQNRVTQRDLAAALGMHEQTVSNKMCGTRPFTLCDLTRIADFFDVSVDALLGREPLEVK